MTIIIASSTRHASISIIVSWVVFSNNIQIILDLNKITSEIINISENSSSTCRNLY
jgi:hypothetical protein